MVEDPVGFVLGKNREVKEKAAKEEAGSETSSNKPSGCRQEEPASTLGAVWPELVVAYVASGMLLSLCWLIQFFLPS